MAENRFTDYVTSTAFSLTLSRPMCDAMQFVRAQELTPHGYRVLPTVPSLMTMQSLERRGLIEGAPWRLTEAGRLLYPLLALAGLVQPETELRELVGRLVA